MSWKTVFVVMQVVDSAFFCGFLSGLLLLGCHVLIDYLFPCWPYLLAITSHRGFIYCCWFSGIVSASGFWGFPVHLPSFFRLSGFLDRSPPSIGASWVLTLVSRHGCQRDHVLLPS